jgi:tetratricopeptide (TPR) repeat protein
MRIGGEAVMRNADPYRLALVYYREKDYESALSTIRYIIRERPGELHWAYHAWGIILEAQGKNEEALERLRQATRAKPDFDMGWRRQAYLLNQLQRYEEARNAYQQAMTSGSLTPQNWLNYGWFLHSQQMYEKADSAFEQATRMAPGDSRVWLAWVDSKVSRNDHQAAEALLDKVDILLQENAEGYLYRGLISFVKADTAAAIEHVQTAYQLDPTNEATVKMMMQGAFVSQDYERIIRVFEQTNWLQISESIRQNAWNMTAMSYNMLQRHESAHDLIRRTIAINSTIAYPYTTLAETFAFTGQYDSCYHYLEKALQMGFRPESFNLDMPPYPVLKEQQPFQNLLERYGKLKD